MISPVRVLYEQLNRRLRDRGIWGANVFSDGIPAEASRPCLLFYLVSGFDPNETRQQDFQAVVMVKCIADSLDESILGSQQISDLLDDKGAQDCGAIATQSLYWVITTITQNDVVHDVEMFERVRPIYHDGWEFDIMMRSLGNA
jgi:hypothetical protein